MSFYIICICQMITILYWLAILTLVTLLLVTRINKRGYCTRAKSLISFGVFIITLSHVTLFFLYLSLLVYFTFVQSSQILLKINSQTKEILIREECCKKKRNKIGPLFSIYHIPQPQPIFPNGFIFEFSNIFTGFY